MAEGVSFDLGRQNSFERLRLGRGLREGSSWPKLGENTAAPLPDFAGVSQPCVLGHELRNQRHRDVEKLTAISPRAKTGSRGGRSAPATKNGGRRGSCAVQRHQA